MRIVQQSADSAGITVKIGDRVILALLFVFLATEVFGGALRYYLTTIGVPGFAYIPKLLIMSAYVAVALRTVYTMRLGSSLLGAMLLSVLFLLVGAYYTQNWIQPLFGVYLFMPLLFAVLAEPAISRFGERLLPYTAVLWLCAASGALYDYMTDVPWAGLAYQLGDLEIQGSRFWTAFGIERIAGFSRGSYALAEQLLFLALFWVILGRRRIVGLSVWFATGGLIALTTMKTTAGVYLILTLLLPLMKTNITSRKLKNIIRTVCPALIVLAGIALPTSTLFIGYQIDSKGPVSRFLFASFEDRLTWTWPKGFELVFDHGNAVLGRGIGGIGGAQKHFEPLIYSPADNLYVYLYATFGLLAFALIGLYTIKICRLDIHTQRWSRLIWFSSIAVLMSGWTANGIEGAFTSCLLGLTLAYIRRRRRAAIPFRHRMTSLHNSHPRVPLHTHHTASTGNRFM